MNLKKWFKWFKENVMDPATIAALIGGTAATASAGVGALNWLTGRDIAEKNYTLQGAQFDYMKSMQQQAWAREDNAVQRRVADLKAAGLSPTLAAGSGASSSSPIQITVPRKEFVPLNVDALGQLGQVTNISQTRAQTALTAIEAEKQRWNLDWSKERNLPTDADPRLKLIEDILIKVFGKNSGGISDVFGKVEVDAEKMKNVPYKGLDTGVPVIDKILKTKSERRW